MTPRDVSGLPVARAVARCYDGSSCRASSVAWARFDEAASTPPQRRNTDTRPMVSSTAKRGVLIGLCIASVLWSVIVVVLSFTL